ncbi:T9SS type A sorting domain-containing protein [Winogradskyella sp.]|uniref:T9SS type A sorting domain-containing protein n=1 Tax=Winogradskyella sp. TaxID=1883156 RepID=UPI0026273CD6|nr:T9SS type A sorting domain-containing protein [Winogradskyella sp.]
MKKILLSTILIYSLQVLSQEALAPINGKSFGLNHHTNRDISYFSHIDSNNNTLIVGTTEKDTTFTDIITTKLDENYNVLWQKVVSQPTNLSYDVPIKSFLNSSNQLYIIGRSSFNQSYSNGLIFVIKFDESGNILYNITLGGIYGNDYRDFAYMDAALKNNGHIDLVYDPREYDTTNINEFIFLTIDNQGNIIESFNHIIPNDGLVGTIKNGEFYFLTREYDSNYNSSFFYHKVSNSNSITSLLVPSAEFQNYYNNVVLSENLNILVDDNGNCYLNCYNTSDNSYSGQINLTKIDINNNLVYSLTSSNTQELSLVGSFIDSVNNKNILIVNNSSTNVLNFASIDENNTLQLQPHSENIIATGFKKNSDESFFITTSNSNIRLFSEDFNQLASFNTSNDFELIDFSKIDDQNISVIGTSYDRMFPNSDYFTQLDIKVNKLNSSQVTQSYTYSGIGTSKAFQQRVIIDNENNYLVLVTEKMGPEFLGIGGADPPLNKRIIKYDSNLTKLWELTIPDPIFNLVNHGGKDIDFFIDNNNNLYLNLPRPGNHYGLGYSLYKVSPNGILEYINDTFVGSKFHANEDYILIGWNYFLYEDASTFYLLDRTTGNLINEIEIGHEEFLDFFTIGNDYYFYTFRSISNNTPDFIYLYKNGIKQWTRNLSNNYGIFPYFIDSSGTLYFATRNPPERRINKLSLANNYSYYNTVDDIRGLKEFNNSNIFLFLDNNESLVLDNNLNLVSDGDTINANNIYLMTYDDYILLGSNNGNIRVIDENGSIIKHYFLQNGALHRWYSKFDNQNNFILVGATGNRISTFNEYSWSIGTIHNYGNFNEILGIEGFGPNDLTSVVNIYPNPTSDFLNVEIIGKSIANTSLYDLSGKKLEVFNKDKINIKNFQPGIYLLSILTTSNEVFNTKIVKN